MVYARWPDYRADVEADVVSHLNALDAERAGAQEAVTEYAAAPIPLGDKILFGAVALLALWVAAWGWFEPGSVPPEHERLARR